MGVGRAPWARATLRALPGAPAAHWWLGACRGAALGCGLGRCRVVRRPADAGWGPVGLPGGLPGVPGCAWGTCGALGGLAVIVGWGAGSLVGGCRGVQVPQVPFSVTPSGSSRETRAHGSCRCPVLCTAGARPQGRMPLGVGAARRRHQRGRHPRADTQGVRAGVPSGVALAAGWLSVVASPQRSGALARGPPRATVGRPAGGPEPLGGVSAGAPVRGLGGSRGALPGRGPLWGGLVGPQVSLQRSKGELSTEACEGGDGVQLGRREGFYPPGGGAGFTRGACDSLCGFVWRVGAPVYPPSVVVVLWWRTCVCWVPGVSGFSGVAGCWRRLCWCPWWFPWRGPGAATRAVAGAG